MARLAGHVAYLKSRQAEQKAEGYLAQEAFARSFAIVRRDMIRVAQHEPTINVLANLIFRKAISLLKPAFSS